MMALYTSKAFSRDHVAIMYYSIVLTSITVLVAASIGVIQVLALIQGAVNPPGSFWDGVGVISDNFDIIGGCICGLFLLLGIASVLLYRPWRRRIERNAALVDEPYPVDPALQEPLRAEPALEDPSPAGPSLVQSSFTAMQILAKSTFAEQHLV